MRSLFPVVFLLSFFAMSNIKPPSCPPLIISLLHIRRVLKRLAGEIDWESPMLEYIAELEAHLHDAFRGP
ncbi:MAG: hypothetical protein GY807_06165 [Gammaproteobacteria bacterium]|nr:hypothetical protein [Gammaproteobacteria bacterium]